MQTCPECKVDRAGLLVIATARPERHPARPGPQRNSTTIALSSLSDEQTARLIAALLGQSERRSPCPETLNSTVGGDQRDWRDHALGRRQTAWLTGHRAHRHQPEGHDLASDADRFFTEPHYNGFPAVLVRLPLVEEGELRESTSTSSQKHHDHSDICPCGLAPGSMTGTKGKPTAPASALAARRRSTPEQGAADADRHDQPMATRPPG